MKKAAKLRMLIAEIKDVERESFVPHLCLIPRIVQYEIFKVDMKSSKEKRRKVIFCESGDVAEFAEKTGDRRHKNLELATEMVNDLLERAVRDGRFICGI